MSKNIDYRVSLLVTIYEMKTMEDHFSAVVNEYSVEKKGKA
jgi:hypothetical protein